jgi:hypothetical protein
MSITPLFAKSGYWDGFVEFWTKSLRETNNIVLFIGLVGALCITVIVTGGRWKK